MKLIFVNRFFYPDHSASSQMLSDLAFSLAARGCPVSIITSRQLYGGPGQPLPAFETVDNVDVHRVWTSRFGRRNLPGRFLDYASFYLSAARRLWQLVRPGDTVVAKTDPPMLSLLVVPIARLRGARAVSWLQDLFPEVAEQLHVGGRAGRAAFAMLRPLRDLSLRSADLNVVVGERMADRLAALGVARDRIAIIANWADGQSVRPVASAANSLRTRWNLCDSFVVGYSGNLGRAHDIDTILTAIDLVERRQNGGTQTEPPVRHIVWLFVGGGNQLEALRARLATRPRASVHFENYQPREALAESLSAADVHLVVLRPELEGLIVPSKFYGIAAAGRPTIFIGHRDGEIARAVTRTGCGLNIDQGAGRALADAVIALADDPARCNRMGVAARHAFESEFDKPIAMARWTKVLGLPAPSHVTV